MSPVIDITGTLPIREPGQPGTSGTAPAGSGGTRIAATIAAPQTTTRASIRREQAMPG